MNTHDRFIQQPHVSRLAGILLAALIGMTLLIGLVSEALAVPRSEFPPFGEGVLWQVERPGEEPSYVFGTIHLNRDDILAVPEAVKQALAKARSASFEIKMDDETATAMSRAAFTGGRNTLDALIGPDLFSDVVAAAEPYGLTVHHVRHLKPWAVVMLLGKPPSVVEDESEDDGKPVLDDWLYDQAEERGIPTFGLESVRQHLSPFEDLSPQNKRRLIRAMLDDLDVDQTEIERRHAELVRLYLEGKIGTIISSEVEETPTVYADLMVELNRRLLDDRNHLMVERMLPRLKDGRAFVAIGAGHLPGEEGILSLLTERGYKVRRIH